MVCGIYFFVINLLLIQNHKQSYLTSFAHNYSKTGQKMYDDDDDVDDDDWNKLN